MRLTPLISLACTMTVVLCTGCNHLPGPPQDSQELMRPQDELNFQHLYRQNCSACHGSDGRNGPALDLANPHYQLIVDDASLKKWITGGMPGTQMPAFGESAGGMLTEKQVDALVSGSRKACRTAGSSREERTPPHSADLQGDPIRGGQVYTASCLSCHQGEKQKITGATYLALVSDQALRTIILAGRPDLGHPGWQNARSGGPLSDQDVTDVVSYLGSLRSKTPGQPYPEQQKR